MNAISPMIVNELNTLLDQTANDKIVVAIVSTSFTMYFPLNLPLTSLVF